MEEQREGQRQEVGLRELDPRLRNVHLRQRALGSQGGFGAEECMTRVKGALGSTAERPWVGWKNQGAAGRERPAGGL